MTSDPTVAEHLTSSHTSLQSHIGIIGKEKPKAFTLGDNNSLL